MGRKTYLIKPTYQQSAYTFRSFLFLSFMISTIWLVWKTNKWNSPDFNRRPKLQPDSNSVKFPASRFVPLIQFSSSANKRRNKFRYPLPTRSIHPSSHFPAPNLQIFILLKVFLPTITGEINEKQEAKNKMNKFSNNFNKTNRMVQDKGKVCTSYWIPQNAIYEILMGSNGSTTSKRQAKQNTL